MMISHKVTKSQSHKAIAKRVDFAIILVTLCLGVLAAPCYLFALNLDKVKIHILKEEYGLAIIEGEKILAVTEFSKDFDELHYLLALSYMKEGNLLRASDIFEIIINEFEDSKFKDEAKLGLGDTYFLREDFLKAKGQYESLLDNSPNTKLKAQVYYRLSEVSFRSGDTNSAKNYLDKLKEEFRLNPELRLNKDMLTLAKKDSSFYYTIQVGSFINRKNAENLKQELILKNYPAYTEETDAGGKPSYRVRVGRMHQLDEAKNLKNKLSQEGYPTKIYP